MARRYTLQEIRNKAEGHFFDRATMKHFKGDTYGTRFDSIEGKNYLYSLREGSVSKGIAWWFFDPSSGKLKPLGNKTPPNVKEV
jgi:hypothetical protein